MLREMLTLCLVHVAAVSRIFSSAYLYSLYENEMWLHVRNLNVVICICKKYRPSLLENLMCG